MIALAQLAGGMCPNIPLQMGARVGELDLTPVAHHHPYYVARHCHWPCHDKAQAHCGQHIATARDPEQPPCH
jgi:hypothetical protein